ncbi:MAG TPA: MFS transporter [Lautropia sp.]|nr:MFS transporter [Lautropia sp.]
MVAAGSGLQFMQAALLHQAFGAYFAALVVERGWSKAALSGAAALQPMESALLGPALGWIVDRFGPQGMIRIGVVAFGLGFIVLSQIDSLAGFYVAFIIIALGSSLCGFFPINVAIIHWFQVHRARALSSVGLGLALGGIFVPAVAWSIQSQGWRTTAFASGVLAIVLGWPLAKVFRRNPAEIGETVDGLPVPAPVKSREGDDASGPGVTGQEEFTAREALRTQAFWFISLGHGFALLVVYAVNVHAITHMKEGLGYSLAQASLVITLMTAAQIGGVLLGWWIGDRFDKRRVSALCMLMHAVGLLMLTYAQDYPMLIGFALFHGGAWGLRGPFMQAIRADYFGRRAIGMILGLSSLIIVFGQVGGPMIAGLMADATGSYLAGFTLLAVMVGAGSLFFLFARRPYHTTAT